MAGSAARRATTAAIGCAISSGDSIGPATCSSRLRARPSQKTGAAQARFHKVGVWRLSRRPGTPCPCALPSAKPLLRSWQLAQERLASMESRVSWNNYELSARLFTQLGLLTVKDNYHGPR